MIKSAARMILPSPARSQPLRGDLDLRFIGSVSGSGLAQRGAEAPACKLEVLF